MSKAFVVRGTYDPDPLIRYRSHYGQNGVKLFADYRIEVDAGIREPVRVLNEVFGWQSFSSCEGHLCDDIQSYVAMGCIPNAELMALSTFLEHEGFEDVRGERIRELMTLPPQTELVYELTIDDEGNMKISDNPPVMETRSGADLISYGMISWITDSGRMARWPLGKSDNPVEKDYVSGFASGLLDITVLTADGFDAGDLCVRYIPDEFDNMTQSDLDTCRDCAWEYLLDILRRFKIHYHQLGNN